MASAEDSKTETAGGETAKLAEDSLSECSSSTADRFSCSAFAPSAASVPPRLVNSSSWAFLSDDNFQHVPTQTNFGWVHQLSQRPIAVHLNSFIRSDPLPEAQLLDLLASMTIGQQQPRGERFHLDIRFTLEIVRLDQLWERNVRVLSSELAQLNLPTSSSCSVTVPLGDAVPSGTDGIASSLSYAVPPPSGIAPSLSHLASPSVASLCFDLLPFPFCRMASVYKFPRHLLFLYPQSANFSARTGQNARNISVKAELFTGKSENRIEKAFVADGQLVGEVFSSVQYHSRHAQFGGTEWKLIVPWGSGDGLFLRFTFLHISCKFRGDNAKMMCPTPIGFSWLPLQSADHFSSPVPSGDHQLPISLDAPPLTICSLSPHANVPNVHWLDSHRPLFHLRIFCVSSVQPQDPHLSAFLASSRAFLRSPSALSADLFAASLRNVLKCSPDQILSFLHVILHKLLAIIVTASRDESAEFIANCAFETICQLAVISTMLLDGRVDARNRSHLLLEFVLFERLPMAENGEEKQRDGGEAVWRKREQEQDARQQHNGRSASTDRPMERATQSRALLHHQLVRLFISSSGHARDSACSSAWFLLSLIHRSLVEHLDTTQGHLLPRKLRFGGSDFLQQIAQLGELLIAEMMERAAKNAAQADAINLAWAQFLRDSIALLARGWIVEQMRRYCDAIDARIK